MMHVQMPRLWIVAYCCLSLFAGFCGLGCLDANDQQGSGGGPGHRKQTLALSPEQELALGQQAYLEVLHNPKKYGRVLPADRPEVKRVRAIAQSIIQAVGIEPLRREMNLREGYQFEWEVNVFDNDQVNAFCLPGGKVAVFTGILRVSRNDDQVATVIAHEIGHALAHHSSERLARKEMSRGAIGGIWSKSFDREQESEADHIGLFLMVFAGYDPDEAIKFWELMQQATGGSQALPEILSDHPSDAHRIQDLKVWVPKARAAKRAFDTGHIAPASSR